MNRSQSKAKWLANKFASVGKGKTGKCSGYFNSGRRAYDIEFRNGRLHGKCHFYDDKTGEIVTEIFLNL